MKSARGSTVPADQVRGGRLGRITAGFDRVPTMRVNHWMRRILLVLGLPLLLLTLIGAAVTALATRNGVSSVVMIVTGVVAVPLLFFAAGYEQRRVNGCWRAAGASGADPVYVFVRGWRTVGGVEESLGSGWIGVTRGRVAALADAARPASVPLLAPGQAGSVSRRTVFGGMAYSQLEIDGPDLQLRLELVNDKRLLFSFLSDAQVDAAVAVIRDAIVDAETIVPEGRDGERERQGE